MKKLVSVMVIAMVLVLAFTVAANAEAWTPQTDGLYDFTFDLDADKTGTMYGMVVIEAADDAAAFTLNEDNIRYIDQVTANGSTLSFTDVGPMDLQDGGKYYVYIGGDGILGEDGLPGAKRIGTLSAAGTNPEPPVTPTFTVTFVADGVTVATKTVNVGESLAVSEFPEVPAKSGYTGAWSVNEAITEEITVNAVYTPITTPDPGEGDDEEVLGDMDGNGTLDDDDAIHLLFHYLIDEEKYLLSADGDVDGSGIVDDDDAIHLLFHYLIDEEKYPLYPNK